MKTDKRKKKPESPLLEAVRFLAGLAATQIQTGGIILTRRLFKEVMITAFLY